MNAKLGWIVAFASLAGLGFVGYRGWHLEKENQTLIFLNTIYQTESRILKDEVNELYSKPTYDQGYKAALIRVGGPQTTGAYADGWDDAMKVYMDAGYADGYHNAITQFGYTKNSTMTRWLAPEPKTLGDKSMKDGGIPTKMEKKQ